MIPAIDSHIHIWDRTRGETFIAEKQFPQLAGKAFLPRDVPQMLEETGATKAVLVHGPSSLTHTAHCLEMANAHYMLLSVIGWINVRGGAWRNELAEFSSDPLFRGIRLMPGLDPEPEAFLRSQAVAEAAREIGKANQILEVLAGPELFPAVATIARAAPDTTISLAHFGLPTGAIDQIPLWRGALSEVAACPRTIIKVSGLPLCGNEKSDSSMAVAHLEVLLDQFGPDRMCYSSNWPVATAHAPPAYWRRILDLSCDEIGFSGQELASLYHSNTRRYYSPNPHFE